VSFIQHTSAGTRNGTKDGAVFQFDWIPPSTNVGSITLYVAGNAANGDGNLTGDHIYTSSVQLDPAIPVTPTTSGVVSAATLATGPVAPNSWLTIYGSDLSVTTRGWADSDFVNGLMPFSLDGVSVELTVFGAPRLAYVSYVSPTQINFLMPSDASAGSYQVQVRNAAGMSKQTPLTVAANAAQLFTLDGKYVAGVRADGSNLTKASPGEKVILYATGCGPTSPALIPGLVPGQANSLATQPQVTIGGATAALASAAALPGSPGIFQLSVQIPMDAKTGDLPVQLQIGTTMSVAALITIQ
jgi:uncharacterized protein (TIGR03437 family)